MNKASKTDWARIDSLTDETIDTSDIPPFGDNFFEQAERHIPARKYSLMLMKQQATIEDLYCVPDNGKAELVNGEIVLMSPTGGLPGYAGGEIFASMRDFVKRNRLGYAFPDNVGFVVNLPHRRSLSPDAAFYAGQFSGGDFLNGAPLFAVEVRSESDYGPVAEQKMADKRADYFAAGTQVVWDTDILREEEIHKYSASNPDHPVTFRRGETADAEPVLPGWRFAVDAMLP